MFAFVVRADMARTVAMFANDLWLTLGLAEPQKGGFCELIPQYLRLGFCCGLIRRLHKIIE